MSAGTFHRTRIDDFVVERLGGELLIYDRRTDVAHCLGSVAAVVFERCDGGASLEQLASGLLEDGLAESADEAHELAAAAVHELTEKDLIEGSGDGGELVSRRRALRRLAGVGAGAALAPLVVSAAVPTPAAAAGSPPSCKTAGQSCSPPNSLSATNNCCTQSPALSCTSVCVACTTTGGTPSGTGCSGCTSGASNPCCCSGKCGTGGQHAKCA